MSIVETSIKKPLLIVIVFAALTIGGIISYNALNLNLLPRIEMPVITIQTIYPGAGASEVETSVTKKVEDALSSLENLKEITSTSMEGVSVVAVRLRDGADENLAVQDAQRKIGAIKYNLPSDILEPSINKISLDEKSILNIAASSSLSSTEFYKLVEDRIQPRISKLSGVGEVKIVGGSKREIKVNINADKLKSYKLSILQVLQAIQTANVEMPAGNVENSSSVYSVRLSAKYSNLDELLNTVITTTSGGGKIKIMDVAEVEDGIAEQKLVNRINTLDAIGLSVKKQSDANAVSVADIVKNELQAIEKEYTKDDVKFKIATDDSIYTKASASAVVIDLILAILIVSIVCLAFLHNIRSALIIMVSVPLSIIPAFIVMYVLGYSLNMMSLMALSLVVGILVDDSIVVIENMFRHLEAGKPKRRAAIDGCKQIMLTCMAITTVIVVVFLPLMITGGVVGNVLKEFAIPIVVATLCSLLVSFTVTPLLMSRYGQLSDSKRDSIGGRISNFIERAFEFIKRMYVRVLAFGLKHKAVVLSLTVVLLIASVALVPTGFIGTAFMPATDDGKFNITLDMNPQLTIYKNNQITMQAEEIIKQMPEVDQIYTNVGLSGYSTKNNVTTITVSLVDKQKRSRSVEQCAQGVKEQIMQDIPGVRARVSISSLGGGGMEPIQIQIQGTEFEKVERTAEMVLRTVKSVPGTTDAKYSTDEPRYEVKVKLDREKMSQLGLSVSDVGMTLRTALNGNDKSKYRDGDYEYDIKIGFDNFDKTSTEDVAKITFLNKRGELIELKQFADISYGLGPSALERIDRVSSITVKSNVIGRPTGTVGAEIFAAIGDKIPEGVTVKKGGMMEQQESTFGSLGIAFLAAIVLIYFVMVILYDSLIDPLVVLFSIPLSIIGALFALALTMNDLTLFSIIGLIILIGLVSKNAILLVDFTNHMRRDKGFDTVNALIEAGKERLRPILMTTMAMVFGMLPIALSSGHGAEMKNGMGWVIIGGLTSSMVLTLVVVPVIYDIFHNAIEKYQRAGRKKLIQKTRKRLAELPQ